MLALTLPQIPAREESSSIPLLMTTVSDESTTNAPFCTDELPLSSEVDALIIVPPSSPTTGLVSMDKIRSYSFHCLGYA